MSIANDSATPTPETPPKSGAISKADAASLVIAGTSIVCWLALFTFGISVGTTTYMRTLDPDDPKNLHPTWMQVVEIWDLQNKKRIPPLAPSQFAELHRGDAEQLLAAAKALEPAPSDKPKLNQKDVLIAIEKLQKELGQSTFAEEGQPNRRSAARPTSPAENPVADRAPELSEPLANPTQTPANNPSAEGTPAWKASVLQLATLLAVVASGDLSWEPNKAESPLLTPLPTARKEVYPGLPKSWFGVFFCNTIVNLGLLSCLASLIGALYYAARQQIEGKPHSNGLQWYLSGLVQGFVMYLAVLAGMLALGELPIESVTTAKYARIAGIVSVLSFWAGYTPNEFFASIINRAVHGAQTNQAKA